ncbi:MAG: ABC transporter permease [Acidobacteriota bacterium]|nr:ABC transporter permease [Acidobacteriota bacterium]
MWTPWQDLRYSFRLLARHPGFTVTAVCVLALGIGVNAGIFGLINGMLLRPLPGASADGELIGLYSHDRTTERSYRAFSFPDFTDIRSAGGPFRHLAAHNLAMVGVKKDNNVRQAFADVVGTGYFETLGVRPAIGRTFTLEEERPGSGLRSVIVSYRYWERTGFDRGILGHTVHINGQDYGVVGVAPEGFAGTTSIMGAEFWVPLGVHDEIENDFDSREHRRLSDRQAYALIVIGRLKPGVTPPQAEQQLKAIAAANERAFPAENRNQDLVVRPLSRMSISTSPMDDSQLWSTVALLQALAGAVLLIACLNLANMMLAAGAARQKEIAIRLAVGSGRLAIVRQLMVHGMLLSLMGGVAGLLLASWSLQLAISSFSTVLPIAVVFSTAPDSRVVGATFLFCTLATVGFGLWPALRLARTDAVPALKDQAGEIGGRLGGRVTVRDALLAAQLALSLALLIVSGLFVRAASAGAEADPGFRLEPIVVAQVEPRLGGYDDARSRELRRASLERLRGVSGVEAASSSSVLPFGIISISAGVQREGPRLTHEDPEARGKLVEALQYVVGSDYFRTLGVTMLRGREFTPAEEAGPTGSQPVIIDAPLAARLFPDQDPVGRVLQFGAQSGTAAAHPMEIVGVAPGLRHDLFSSEFRPHIYLPSGGSNAAMLHLFVRTAAPGGADGIVPAIRNELMAVDSEMPLILVQSFAAMHEQSAAVWMLRAAARLFLTLGLAAGFVAVVGLYGVRSYMVSRRTREFGVRMAVGASPADILRLVMREAASTTTVGLAAGLAIGALLGLVMDRFLYQVSSFDPISFVSASAALTAASLAATLVAARRAARVSPMAALRDS